jgi:hypothetical protein
MLTFVEFRCEKCGALMCALKLNMLKNIINSAAFVGLMRCDRCPTNWFVNIFKNEIPSFREMEKGEKVRTIKPVDLFEFLEIKGKANG